MSRFSPTLTFTILRASLFVLTVALLFVSVTSAGAFSAPILGDGPGTAYGTGVGGNGGAGPGTPKPWLGGSAGLNMATGNKLTTIPITGWSTRGGLPISFSLYHNSADPNNGDSDGWDTLAKKWRYSYDSVIVPDISDAEVLNYVTLTWDDGSIVTFVPHTGGTFRSSVGEHGTLIGPTAQNDHYEYISTTQVHYNFDNCSDGNYRLNTIRDRNNNTIVITRQSTAPYNVLTVGRATGDESAPRQLSLIWTGTQLTQVQDALGRVWSLEYATQGTGLTAITSLTAIDMPTLNDGHAYKATFGYTSDGHWNLQTTAMTTDGVAHPSTWEYKNASYPNMLTDVTDPLGNHTNFQYNVTADGNGSTVTTDPNGHQTTQNYSGGALSTVYDGLNARTATYSYDSDNNVNRILDGRVLTWQRIFDGMGNQVRSITPDNRISYTYYNSLNDPTQAKDPLGLSAWFNYDANGNLISSVDPNGSGATDTAHMSVITIPANNGGLPTSLADAMGHTAHFDYTSNGWGYVSHTVDPNGVEHWVNYNALGWVSSDYDILGNATVYSRDNWGRVYRIQKGGAAQQPLYRLDGSAGVTAASPHNNADNRIYTADANLAATLPNSGWLSRGVVGYVYVSPNAVSGLVTLHRLLSGGQSIYTANDADFNYFTGLGWVDQGIVGYVYPANTPNTANLTPVYRAWNTSNNDTLYTTGFWEYNNLAAPWQQQGIFCYIQSQAGSLQTVAQYTFDGSGNVLSQNDANGNGGTAIYDWDNRLVSRTNTRGHNGGGPNDTVSYTYDQPNPYNGASEKGLLSYQTTGLGGHLVPYYDADNRVTALNHQDGTWDHYGYDANGNVSFHQDGNGISANFSYDNENRL
jgi:YD repeat-containing protein